jgi:hypothetical protein
MTASKRPRALGGARGWTRVSGQLAVALTALLSACIYDTDNRCGPNQVLESEFCVCAEGFKLMQTECVKVEVPPPPPPSGPGAVCDPTSNPCTDAIYATCQQALNGDRYCTSSGCKDTSECPETYRCITSGATSYCRRPYLGQNASCRSQADCAAYDANVCGTLLSKCLVKDCPTNPCDPDFTCFDPSMYTPGVPMLCVERAVLER